MRVLFYWRFTCELPKTAIFRNYNTPYELFQGHFCLINKQLKITYWNALFAIERGINQRIVSKSMGAGFSVSSKKPRSTAQHCLFSHQTIDLMPHTFQSLSDFLREEYNPIQINNKFSFILDPHYFLLKRSVYIL